MGKISVFNYITLDGYFAGPNGEADWFQLIKKDEEFEKFTHENAATPNTLIWGKTTYDMMRQFWPTEMAAKTDPVMTNAVNNSPKIVFSKSMKNNEEPIWKNVRIFDEINPDEIKKIKEKEEITIIGSGSIIQQLAKHGLIDEYTLIVVPITLGEGKSFFEGVKSNLKLIKERAFKNGVVLLQYSSEK